MQKTLLCEKRIRSIDETQFWCVTWRWGWRVNQLEKELVDEVLRFMMSILQLIEKHSSFLTFVSISRLSFYYVKLSLSTYLRKNEQLLSILEKAKLFSHTRQHQLVPCTQANRVASFLSLHVEKIKHTRIGANMPHAKAGEIDFFLFRVHAAQHVLKDDFTDFMFCQLELLIRWKLFDDKCSSF